MTEQNKEQKPVYFGGKRGRKKKVSDEDKARVIKCVKHYVNLRKLKGFTQQDIADKVGINRASVGRIENGTSLPSLSILAKMAFVVGGELIIVDRGK